ncbi:MAG: DUF4292 domain-containing protein [Desulfarculaceae bacterium]|nr:DUF4292 domain-containing protein [Desulfarculaceae bacterium]
MLKKRNNPVSPVIFFLLAALVYSGCASIKPQQTYKSDKEALETADRLRGFNRKIKASKGTGFLTIEKKNRRVRYRIAWAAKSPDQARITLISSGIPVETLLFNKNRITLYSHTGQHTLKTYKTDNPSLERVLSVPVRINDIISVLTGKIPVKPFDHARFEDNGSKKRNRLILLRSRSDNRTQRLVMEPDGRIREYGFLKSPEQLTYRLRFAEFKKFSSCGIFTRLTIANESGESLVFRIHSFQKNPDVKDSVFNLTKAGE